MTKETLEISEGELLSYPYENDWVFMFEDIEINGSTFFYYETLNIGHTGKLNEEELAHIETLKPYITERANAALNKKMIPND